MEFKQDLAESSAIHDVDADVHGSVGFLKRFLDVVIGTPVFLLGLVSFLTSVMLFFMPADIDGSLAAWLFVKAFLMVIGELLAAFGVVCMLLGFVMVFGVEGKQLDKMMFKNVLIIAVSICLLPLLSIVVVIVNGIFELLSP